MAKFESEQFFSINPDVLVETRALTFDVFVRLELSERIVLLTLSGDVISRERIERMKSRGLTALYVRVEHRSPYQQYLALVEADRLAALQAARNEPPKTGAAMAPVLTASDSNAKAPLKERAEGADAEDGTQPSRPIELEPPGTEPSKATEADLKREFSSDVSPNDVMKGLLDESEEGRKQAKAEGKRMLQKILQGPPELDPTAKQILENPDTEHATSVAIYATLFAMGLGQKNQMVLQDVIIASLLHDVGISQGPLGLLAVPVTKRSTPQARAYERHVEDGLSLLSELEYSPNERVAIMLSQHHEQFNGAGYPKQLESFHIDELAQLVGFSDLLDTVCRGRYDGVDRALPEALEVLSEIEKQTTFPRHFDPALFKRIMRWLKDASGKDYMKVAVSAVEKTKESFAKAG